MSSVPPVFKVPALPSQSLPQDLAMLVAMGIVDEPKQRPEEETKEVSPELEEGKGDLGDIEAMLTEEVESQVTSENMEDGEDKEEGEVEEVEEEKEVVVQGKEEEEEEHSGEESDDSSSSAASSSSASSTGSAASTTSAAVGRPPKIPNVKAHQRHLREVDALENAGSDAGSEPDMNEDMFRSTNELPQPSSAPPLPFQQVPFGQALKELGTIMSAVGKQIVIASKPATKQVGKKEVVVEPEALGEGSVICWSDGRVLGVVHDTFGPLTNPLYTLLLPDDFAQPQVLATSYPAISKQAPPSSSSSLPTTNSVASDRTTLIPLSNDIPEEAPKGEVLVQSTGTVVEVEGEVAGVNTFKNEFTEDGLKSLVKEGLIRILSPGPPSPSPASTSAAESQPTASTSTSSPSNETVDLPLSIASTTSTLPHTKPDPDLKWIPTTKDPVTHFVEAVGLTASELVGLTVYFPTQMGKFVPTARLKREKWTDASNKFDEEAGEDEMEWSDDEEEMLAKKRRKMARGSSRAASSVRGGSPTPSDTGSTFSNFPKQHSDFAPSAAASSYAGSAYGGDGSDDDEAMLDYDGQTDGGELLVPERTMPAAYEEWGASEGAPVVVERGVVEVEVEESEDEGEEEREAGEEEIEMLGEVEEVGIESLVEAEEQIEVRGVEVEAIGAGENEEDVVEEVETLLFLHPDLRTDRRTSDLPTSRLPSLLLPRCLKVFTSNRTDPPPSLPNNLLSFRLKEMVQPDLNPTLLPPNQLTLLDPCRRPRPPSLGQRDSTTPVNKCRWLLLPDIPTLHRWARTFPTPSKPPRRSNLTSNGSSTNLLLLFLSTTHTILPRRFPLDPSRTTLRSLLLRMEVASLLPLVLRRLLLSSSNTPALELLILLLKTNSTNLNPISPTLSSNRPTKTINNLLLLLTLPTVTRTQCSSTSSTALTLSRMAIPLSTVSSSSSTSRTGTRRLPKGEDSNPTATLSRTDSSTQLSEVQVLLPLTPIPSPSKSLFHDRRLNTTRRCSTCRDRSRFSREDDDLKDPGTGTLEGQLLLLLQGKEEDGSLLLDRSDRWSVASRRRLPVSCFVFLPFVWSELCSVAFSFIFNVSYNLLVRALPGRPPLDDAFFVLSRLCHLPSILLSPLRISSRLIFVGLYSSLAYHLLIEIPSSLARLSPVVSANKHPPSPPSRRPS